MQHSNKPHLLFALFLFFTSLSLSSLAADATKGKTIFEANCTSCHKLGAVLVGPDLTGVKSRFEGDIKSIIAFVHNPKSEIDKGKGEPSRAWSKFQPVLMPGQPLTDEEITDVIEYVDAGARPAASATAN